MNNFLNISHESILMDGDPPKPASNTQKQAMKKVLDLVFRGEKEVSMTGPAGSGKTTIIRHMIAELEAQGRSVVLVAPTNMAAKVLNLKSMLAATYHSVFFVPVEMVLPSGRKTVSFVPYFEWIANNPKKEIPGKRVSADVTIIDEASMVSGWYLHILRRISRSIILVGDGSQLPPVGDTRNPRGYFNGLTHTATLTEIFRHTGPILDMATRLRTGNIDAMGLHATVPFAPEKTCQGRIFSAVMKELDADCQSWRIITWRNDTRHKMNNFVRRLYGHNGSIAPVAGERMMSMDNTLAGLVNGTEVIVTSTGIKTDAWFSEVCGKMLTVDEFTFAKMFSMDEMLGVLYPTLNYTVVGAKDESTVFSSQLDLMRFVKTYHRDRIDLLRLLARFENLVHATTSGNCRPAELPRIEFAYAITCHKSQGSEFDHVFVIDERKPLYGCTQRAAADSTADEPLFGPENVQRWLYTAYTRARRGLTVIPYEQLAGI